MNLSSVLVYSSLKHIDAVIEALSAVPGVEVHHHCRYSGRIVVIQEHENTDKQIEGLEQIKALPHVIAAEMAYHYVDNAKDARAASANPAKTVMAAWR